MTETTTIRHLLVPELEHEIANTRKLLEALPEGETAFKPHERSMSVAQLAAHIAQMPAFMSMILTTPDLDMSTADFKPLVMESRQQVVAEFNHLADKTLTDLKGLSDEVLMQAWKLVYKGQVLFSGTRYAAYRSMGVNHLVHHRGQLTVYLRLMGAKVPSTFGPTADEPFGAGGV